MIKRIFCSAFAVAVVTLSVSSTDAQSSRKSVSGAEVTGTFKMSFIGKKYKGLTNDLEILALGKGKLKIYFDLIYPYTNNAGEVGVNMGSIMGEASIVGDTAVYSSDEFGPCKITIKFIRPGQVKVTQDGESFDCGFGHNVNAAGSYKKVSAAKPKFESPEK